MKQSTMALPVLALLILGILGLWHALGLPLPGLYGVCSGAAADAAANAPHGAVRDAGADMANATSEQATLNCRLGMTAWEPALSAVDPSQWGAGWFLTFGADGTSNPTMEFMRMVRTFQDKYWDGDEWVFSDTVTFTPPLTDAPGGLGPIVRAHPGAWWAIGNEPDRGPNWEWSWWPGQDGAFPQVYAQAYYSVYHFIKERDPSARVGPGGLVEVTPGRLQYLDLVWQAYLQRYGTSLPADFWTMHLYILPEAYPDGTPNGTANVALGTDPTLAYRESGGNPDLCHNPSNQVYCWADHDDLTLFDQQVRWMRRWLADHGYRDLPLWLTEYGILYPFEDYDDPENPTRCYLQDEFGGCFTPRRVTHWLTQTLEYLTTAYDPLLGNPSDGNRLVQRTAWYCLYTPYVGYVSNLVTGTNTFTMTRVGWAYRDFLKDYSIAMNLWARYAPPAAVWPDPSGVATATIGLAMANNGDTGLPFPIMVFWYRDAAHTQPIASRQVTDLPGCDGRLSLTATWVLSGAGVHPYWAVIDPANQLPEWNEADNVAIGYVLVAPRQQFLPLVMRGTRLEP